MSFLYDKVLQINQDIQTLIMETRLNLCHKHLGNKMFPFVMSKDDNENNDNKDIDSNIKLAVKPKTKIPPLYRVLMMNDDYTPMEFVIEVLEKFFQKNREEATQIMLHVHQRGVGVCGVYAYDLAETKAMQVMNYARKHEHPLQVQLEKE
jgi:ATP-dependent Clp protease adaptor protein ClpS